MKILIIKPSSLGDIIQSNPAYNALRAAYPDAQIHWVIFDKWAQILDLFEGPVQGIIWKKSGGIAEFYRLVKSLRKTEYDIVIDLQGLLRSALLAFFIKAKQKIGVPGMKEFSNLLIKEPAPAKKNINAQLRSIETVKYIAKREFNCEYKLFLPAEAQEERAKILKKHNLDNNDIFVGFVMEARGKGKVLPLSFYKELAMKVLSFNPRIKILLLGTKVSNLINDERVVSFENKTDIHLLSAMLSMCSVVIGPDTGSVHLASALGVPVVMYFGASDIDETAPMAQNAEIISKRYPCSPCRSKQSCDNYPCLRAITPDELMAAAKKYLI